MFFLDVQNSSVLYEWLVSHFCSVFFAHSLIESDYDSTCLDSTLKFCCVNFVEFMRLEVYNILYIYIYMNIFYISYQYIHYHHTAIYFNWIQLPEI